MNAFDSDIKILKEINENNGYIWRPENCNGRNHALCCVLDSLVDDNLLKKSDISTGWWIFENSKILFTLTDKGLDYINENK
jgi:hypothetical protein